MSREKVPRIKETPPNLLAFDNDDFTDFPIIFPTEDFDFLTGWEWDLLPNINQEEDKK